MLTKTNDADDFSDVHPYVVESDSGSDEAIEDINNNNDAMMMNTTDDWRIVSSNMDGLEQQHNSVVASADENASYQSRETGILIIPAGRAERNRVDSPVTCPSVANEDEHLTNLSLPESLPSTLASLTDPAVIVQNETYTMGRQEEEEDDDEEEKEAERDPPVMVIPNDEVENEISSTPASTSPSTEGRLVAAGGGFDEMTLTASQKKIFVGVAFGIWVASIGYMAILLSENKYWRLQTFQLNEELLKLKNQSEAALKNGGPKRILEDVVLNNNDDSGPRVPWWGKIQLDDPVIDSLPKRETNVATDGGQCYERKDKKETKPSADDMASKSSSFQDKNGQESPKPTFPWEETFKLGDDGKPSAIVDNCWVHARANVELGQCAISAGETVRKQAKNIGKTLWRAQTYMADKVSDWKESVLEDLDELTDDYVKPYMRKPFEGEDKGFFASSKAPRNSGDNKTEKKPLQGFTKATTTIVSAVVYATLAAALTGGAAFVSELLRDPNDDTNPKP